MNIDKDCSGSNGAVVVELQRECGLLLKRLAKADRLVVAMLSYGDDWSAWPRIEKALADYKGDGL